MGGPGAWDRFAPEDDGSNDADKRRYQQTWRSLHPQTVKFWFNIDRTAVAAIKQPNSTSTYKRFALTYDGTFLRIVLPSGRAVSYPFPRLETGKFGHPLIMFKDNAAGKWADCRFGQGAYGGLWTENVVQAVSRDLLAAAMQRLEAADYPVTLHVHDEIVCQAPIEFGSTEEFQRLITTLPEWAEGLPITAKVRNGQRFAKSEKPATKPGTAPDDGTDAAANAHDDHAQGDRAHGDAANGNPSGAGGGNGNDRERTDGSKTEAEDDTYAEDNAGQPFNDAYLRAQGYRLTHVFDYTLPDGTLLYQQNRYELHTAITPTKKRPRKRFLAHQKVNGSDVLGAGSRRVIYNWPAVMRAGPGGTVAITEGEANAKVLIEAGLLATTVLSHKWTPECVAALTGCHAIILEDHDDDGRKQSAIARKVLAPVAASIRIVPTAHLWKHLDSQHQEYRDIKLKDDVENWIELGGDPAKLFDICREIPADSTRLIFINMSQWDLEPTPDQEWAVFNRIPRRECVLFSGIGGSGKSITQLSLSVASVLARDWLGVVPEQGPAIFIDAEDDEKVLHRRIKAIAAHYDVTVTEMIKGGLHLVSWRDCDAALAVAARNGKIEPTSLYRELLEAAGDIKPIMIGIAASANVFAGNENDRAQVQQFIGLLTRVAMTANGSIVLISHPSVAGVNTESGLSGSTQWLTVCGWRPRCIAKHLYRYQSADGPQT